MPRYRVSLLVLCAALGDGCDDPDEGGRPPARDGGSASRWLTEITSEAGLDFVHETGARGDLYLPEIMGAGAALFDCDQDGRLDVYLVNGNRALPEASAAEQPTNRLYRQDGDGRFIDVTEASGLGDGGYGMGVAVGDVDNDGDADVYVTNFGRDRLYRSRGDGTFEDATETAGIRVDGWSCSASFFDYDRDGDLDLYVTRYVALDPDKRCQDGAGRPDYCSPKVFDPVPDVLLRNEADGTFTDVSVEAGIGSTAAAGLGVVCEDLNEDGWPDVYVANDAYANYYWVNQGDGTFRDAAVMAGAAYNLHGQTEAGMGVLADDLDHDGWIDLFVTHLGMETNTYYRNRGGRAGFTDATGPSGLGVSSMAYTGFGVAAFDVELDGDLDLAVVNGRVSRSGPTLDSALAAPWIDYAEPNLFYANDGSGRFRRLEQPVSDFCDRIEITRALAVGDVDGDGDLDILISNVQGPARLYRNDGPRHGRWLLVRAVDPRLRRDAIGARVTVYADGRRVARTITRASSYLSSSSPRAHFGLGPVERIERVDVRWPDGLLETFAEAGLDRAVELVRGTGEQRP